MAMLERLRNAAADALMLFAVPCGVALLPWRLGFALLKRLACNERLYRLSVDPAWAAAREHCPGCDEREWKYRFRLLRLVDHADVYLALLRGRRWRRRHVVETGSWPAPGPCVEEPGRLNAAKTSNPMITTAAMASRTTLRSRGRPRV